VAGGPGSAALAAVAIGLIVLTGCNPSNVPDTLTGNLKSVRVEGHSMEPTLKTGDVVYVRIGAPIQRGDVVVYCAGGRSEPTASRTRASADSCATTFIKRVLAVAGDTVAVHPVGGERAVIVRSSGGASEAPVDEPYATGSWTYLNQCCGSDGRADGVVQAVTVPPGDIWALGDNRDVSKDSRSTGWVRTSDVIGTLTK
jgi:signal peptidase I